MCTSLCPWAASEPVGCPGTFETLRRQPQGTPTPQARSRTPTAPTACKACCTCWLCAASSSQRSLWLMSSSSSCTPASLAPRWRLACTSHVWRCARTAGPTDQGMHSHVQPGSSTAFKGREVRGQVCVWSMHNAVRAHCAAAQQSGVRVHFLAFHCPLTLSCHVHTGSTRSPGTRGCLPSFCIHPTALYLRCAPLTMLLAYSLLLQGCQVLLA